MPKAGHEGAEKPRPDVPQPRRNPVARHAPMSVDIGPRTEVLRLQQQAGNAAVGALLETLRVGPTSMSPARHLTPHVVSRIETKPDAGPTEPTRAGLRAFHSLGSWSMPRGGGSVPDIPTTAPVGLRAALGRLRRAQEFHYEVGMPTAGDAVLTRLTEQGPVGAVKWMWYGPAMVLKERLDRAYASKSEWQAVRPVFQALVNRYAGMDDVEPATVAEHRALIKVLDDRMTHKIAHLHIKLAAHTSPEEAKLVLTVIQADKALGAVGSMLKHVKGELKGLGIAAKGVKGVEALSGGIAGGDLPAAGAVDTALNKYNTVKSLLDAVKAAEGLDDTVAKIVQAADKGGLAGAFGASKGTVDASKVVVDLLNDCVKTGLDATGSFLEARAVNLIDSGAPSGLYAGLARQANAFRTMSDALGKVKTPAAILGIASGALSMVEGITSNDAEAGMGGALTMAEGIVGVIAAGGGAASMAASGSVIPILSLRGMLHVVTQMSKSLRAISSWSMREALEKLAGDLDQAEEGAQQFDITFAEFASLCASLDPVDQALADSYARKAMVATADLHNGITTALSSAFQGPVHRHALVADAFTMGYGGREQVVHDFLALKDGVEDPTPGRVMAHASYLKAVLGRVADAVRHVTVTVDGYAAGGPMRFSGVDRNVVTAHTRVSFGGGEPRISVQGFEIDSPVDAKPYRDWLLDEMDGEALGDLHGIAVEVDTKVLNLGSNGGLWQTVKLTGRENRLSEHSDISGPFVKAVTGEGGEAAAAAQTLWETHMSKVKIRRSMTADD
ncbi:hypothetical protein MRU69_15680 [Kocuria flava]|uniref:hypothetical protein n=1 Tax=Kocuria flava TaxID=446860 RepID=UPI001FF3D2D3|nr:hypothetical protein [Kocuria flava]MCJ8506277.1 hypothetical protein [Kocuria flava]